MTTFLALIRKDLLLFVKDRRAVILSVAVPILIASFFGYIFGGGGGNEGSPISILWIDQDQSAISQDIGEGLLKEKTLAVRPSSVEEARAAVRGGKATVAIVMPKDFGTQAGRALFSGENRPELGMMYDPSHQMEFQMVQGILTGHVMQSVTKEMFTGESGRQFTQEALARLRNRTDWDEETRKTLGDLLASADRWNQQQSQQRIPASAGLTIPYAVQGEAVTGRRNVQYNGYAHSFGGMSVQFILFAGIDAGIGLLLMRQRGLWKRLRAAPLSKTMLLGSRATSSALISAFILAVIFAFARMVFGVRIEGSFAGFIGVCAAFSLMTAAFGLLVAALGKTPDAARGISILVTLLMVMLGGAWIPTFVFPPWLQRLAMVAPTRWAVDGLDAMTWRGLEFSAALAPMGGMLACAALFGALAVARFRWEES